METKRSAEQLSRDAQRKRRKQAKAGAKDGGQWNRCMFRVVRKNRYCNISRVPGSLFCGNHLPDYDAVVSKKSQKFKAAARRRVPCPVDASHTVYEYDLAKHVLVCNRVKDADAMKKLPYYSHNINSGSHCSSKEDDKAADVGEPGVEKDEDGNEHSAPSAQEQQGIIDKLQAVDFADLRKRIETAYASCVGALALEKLHHTCCDQLFEEKKKAGASKSVLRHIEQQASIIGHMEKVNLLENPNAVFVELGAGRGMLSLALAQMYPDSLYVLIDRAHTRGKADRFIGGDEAAKERSSTLRAKIDIRHLNFAGMQEIVSKPVVCMSKHLCGVATDLSLRAIAQTLPEPKSDKAILLDSTVSSSFQGLAIALCCHHVCAWEDYVNPEFFRAHGFKPEEFELLTSMTSWTTCGMGLEGDAVQHILGISKDERAALGRQCKRIIDAGRAAYLAQLQLKTRLVHYCDTKDSLENCLLLAWR
ncbi:tRNA guanosine-2'-O-methyltransferase, putative [Phytophthora infestans T30-4]|uniref:tRNA:m(4)X modification enzyme TRM13 n=1 Tax=Phytophthora infestans (strain T30-4) TaxID=403677 RepID=D0N273_PHYIT|nr:tRNA guanosine-2'-O-methyltransferase, putative [Phytophthora infestans T30-4]EEY68402.1 tRNA guanosine-2'-O-methyltransferase, putative [Phytophthora infestans T30-4]|eukprot:XP_002905561.1 tRNA guanosine-2'-O-methyltransferase, putative [Phytophthora infestans T30-4]